MPEKYRKRAKTHCDAFVKAKNGVDEARIARAQKRTKRTAGMAQLHSNRLARFGGGSVAENQMAELSSVLKGIHKTFVGFVDVVRYVYHIDPLNDGEDETFVLE